MADTGRGVTGRLRRAVGAVAKAASPRKSTGASDTGATKTGARKGQAPKAAQKAAKATATAAAKRTASDKRAAQPGAKTTKAPAKTAKTAKDTKTAKTAKTAKATKLQAKSAEAAAEGRHEVPATKRAAAEQTPVKEAATRKAAAKKTTAKRTATKKTTAKRTGPATKTGPAKKANQRKATAPRPVAGETTSTDEAAPMAPTNAQQSPVPARSPAAPESLAVLAGESPWTAEELEEVRGQLRDEIDRLKSDIDVAEEEIADLIRDSGEGAGDDQADAGSKAFEREHEMSLANNAREMLVQTLRALQRIVAGTYGICESCGNPIGKARLQAFPRATLCMTCKQREERR